MTQANIGNPQECNLSCDNECDCGRGRNPRIMCFNYQFGFFFFLADQAQFIKDMTVKAPPGERTAAAKSTAGHDQKHIWCSDHVGPHLVEISQMLANIWLKTLICDGENTVWWQIPTTVPKIRILPYSFCVPALTPRICSGVDNIMRSLLAKTYQNLEFPVDQLMD